MCTFKHFNFSDQESAIASFETLLQSPEVPADRCGTLKEEFVLFRMNRMKQFWEARILKLNTKSNARKLACDAQDTAVEEASAAFGNRGFRPKTGGRDNEESIDPTRNITHFETLNQATSWICNETDMVAKFRDFQACDD
ncbi:hypothetical protein BGX31_007385 [Mortierella sp. GBA43]|nr:hypothetical protein BGX31_007385 [Mortierella sp. GBA43]